MRHLRHGIVILALLQVIGCRSSSLDRILWGRSENAHGTSIYDDFNRSDRTLQMDKSSSGGRWVLSGAGSNVASIRGHGYVSDLNTYASLDSGGVVRKITGQFELREIQDRSGIVLALIADQDEIGLKEMLHLILAPDWWALQLRSDDTSGAFENIASGGMRLEEGKVYMIKYEIQGSTVMIYPPDGTLVSATDERLLKVKARYGIWQIPAYPGTSRLTWRRVEMNG